MLTATTPFHLSRVCFIACGLLIGMSAMILPSAVPGARIRSSR